METINGQLFKKLIISGANNLYNHYPEVDALNVFPVPDGDTGMNMNLTMQSGVKEVSNRNDEDIYNIAKSFSRGLLMGARGNSGVITSQIFRGFADYLINRDSINAVGLAEAFDNSRKVAYKAVIKPVEGTILTVIREASEELLSQVENKMSIEKAFEILLTEAKASLDRTPNLLPVLKEVGVVDSGGAGLICILEGMQKALLGSFIEKREQLYYDVNGEAQASIERDNDEFGYCTEFILRLDEENNNKKKFDEKRFTNVLNSRGNSLVVVRDEDIVKVHVHTLTPGTVLTYAQQFGEFVKLKIENMTEQHNEILINEANKSNEEKSASAKLTEAPLKAAPAIEEKEYAIIATSSGPGIDQLFKEVGVEYIVSGGQTMNPSTQDFIKKIEETHAKVVYILPNNGNIIMAANQAKDVVENCRVEVIPTKTIMQGVVSAMNFNSELSIEDNLEVMQIAISSVKSGAVTFSIKDTEINGVEVKKDDYMAIKETKDILSCVHNKFDALKLLIKELVDEDSAIITILCGEDVTNKEKEEVKAYFNKKYSDLDIDIREGGQPVYSYIVGVE